MTPRRKSDDSEMDRSRPGAEPTQGGPPHETAQAGRTPEERVALLESVVAGLDELLPGLELLDTDLAFDEGGGADLVCMDEHGRLVLVMLAEGAVDSIGQLALDTLSLATRHLDLIWSHLDSPRGAKDEVRLVLVAPDGGERLSRRVAPLCDLGLEVFGMRRLTSARGTRSYLVRLDSRGGEEPSRRSRVETFLGRVPDPVREACRSIVHRMERLDERLVADVRARDIVWRSAGDPFARLEINGRGVYGSVLASGDAHGRRVLVTDEADADRLVEEAMAALVGVPVERAPREVLGRTPSVLDGPDEDARGEESHGAFDGPLLTPEELEAFRD